MFAHWIWSYTIGSSSPVFVRETRVRKTRKRALKLQPVRNKVIQRGKRINPAILLALLSPRKVREFLILLWSLASSIATRVRKYFRIANDLLPQVVQLRPGSNGFTGGKRFIGYINFRTGYGSESKFGTHKELVVLNILKYNIFC